MASEIGPLAPIGATSAIGGIAPVPAVPTTSKISVGIYTINKFASHASCKQSALHYCNFLGAGFSGAMRHRGHDVPIRKTDQQVSPKQWNHGTQNKADGIDGVEFAYLASHGYFFGTALKSKPGQGRTPWLFWFLANCDSADGCWISTIDLVSKPGEWAPPDAGKPKVNLRLGGGRVRWVVLDCCRSLQMRDENEDEAPYKNLTNVTPGELWSRCYDGVNMLFGFTGLSSDADWTKERGQSFGLRAGRGEGLADSWIDEAYSWIIKGVDAPVVTAFGKTAADADQLLKSGTIKNAASPTRPTRSPFSITMWRK